MIDYILADPTGNITALVRDPYTSENKSNIVSSIFEIEPTCEQVGFIASEGTGEIMLEMMGGEFCGNATLSAAAYQAYTEDLSADDEVIIKVNSSGISEPVPVIIRRGEDIKDHKGAAVPTFVGTLEMPIPSIGEYAGYPVIDLDGISHMLVPCSDMSDEDAERKIKDIAVGSGSPAFGIILYDEEDLSADTVRIRPLVYVKGSNTLVWEHGCASGSISMGYYRYVNNSENNTTVVKQPGGSIQIDIEDGRLFLTGRVILDV